jgi:hypothetical protein
MTFKVMAERCDQCLYGPNKIVSDESRKQILRDTVQSDRHFICHKATIAGTEACCRGDWDAHCGGQLGRIAGRLGVVQFVTEAALRGDER